MNPKSKLESILTHEYQSEDGESYKIELLEGMTNEEITEYKYKLPNKQLPIEIEELLRYCKGFKFIELDEVRFDTFGQFGFEEMFPYSIPLAGDGYGNFWIVDIDSKGNWNSIYYICHDPAVVVKQSENLTQFIEHIHEFGIKGSKSNLDIIHEQIVMEIWNDRDGIMERNEENYNFDKEQVNLPENYLVADLVNAPIKSGFAWGRYGPTSKIIRPKDQPIWIVEKLIKQSFLSRLFGRNNE